MSCSLFLVLVGLWRVRVVVLVGLVRVVLVGLVGLVLVGLVRVVLQVTSEAGGGPRWAPRQSRLFGWGPRRGPVLARPNRASA